MTNETHNDIAPEISAAPKPSDAQNADAQNVETQNADARDDTRDDETRSDEKYAQKPGAPRSEGGYFSGEEKGEKAKSELSGDDAEAQMRRMSRRSFLWSIVAVGGTVGGVKWLSSRRLDSGVPWPFRRVLQTNEDIAREILAPRRLAPTFARSQIDPIRTNGLIGLDDWDASEWILNVEGLASGETRQLVMKEIKALPRIEMITELKCIEGWSVVNHWAGARFSDFAALVGPATQSGQSPDVKRKPDDVLEYVGLETPDGGYYVGLDTATALHPQTLLCYEMNGAPLLPENGAPLRLVTPLKYGIKNIKRIGTIRFAPQRPADYWAEQGYDWYAGH